MSQVVYFVLGTSFMLLMVFAIIGFVYLYQQKLNQKAKAYREIEQLMQAQELQSAYAVIEGQEHERRRIAAEVHDNIGGLLATAKIYSDLALQKTEAAEIRRLNIKVSEVLENLGIEVRKLSHELDTQTLSGFGLKLAIEHLCEAITISGRLIVHTLIESAQPPSENISFNLYRILQEMLTNTLKHAAASTVRIELVVFGNEVTLIYEDNGQGFDPALINAGIGLKNIRHRVNQMNGKLTIDSGSRGSTFIIELQENE